jgi:Ser/Thr protein kinase RdoA (MazF antagonist)
MTPIPTTDFHHLDAAGQIARLDALARRALDAFGLVGATAALVNYTNNAVYRVDAGDPRYALRIHRPGRKSQAEIEAELAWLTLLRRDTGLRVPLPAAPVYVGELDGVNIPVYAVLFHWQDGVTLSPGEMTSAHAEAVGRFAAALHLYSQTLTQALARPRLDWEGLFGRRSPYQPSPEGDALITPEQRAVIAGATAHIQAVMAAFGDGETSFGLIHADLIAKNLLFDGDDRVIALDFDDCGYGYYLYDLAPMLLSFKDEPSGEALRSGLWAGYTALRPQPPAAESHLEALIAARHIASIRWIAGNVSNPSIRDRAPGIIAHRVALLGRFLDTGRL